MIFHGFDVCCPFCKGDLRQLSTEEWQCVACFRSYPVIFGIPDLRIFPDPDIDFENDRAKAVHLATHFDELTFEELVRFYYLTTPAVPQHRAQQYLQAILAAEGRAESLFQDWLPFVTKGAFLEVGCGTAPLLVAAGKRLNKWIGVDIALRWLIIAKKRLYQQGLQAPFICACAESLPFQEQQFEMTAFDSVLERVNDQQLALLEAFRVMMPAGKLLVITPNRYSLGLDPHTHLWAGGYLPDRWIAAYARRRKALRPSRKLLSARDLRRLIQKTGLEQVSLSAAAITKSEQQRLPGIFRGFVPLYNMSRKAPLSGLIFRSIGPVLQAVAKKPEVENE